MLATVNEYQVTARKFIVSYFNAYAPDRPGQDSLGRVSFLQTMVDKEVLGRTARAAGYQLTYEERLVMREHTGPTVETEDLLKWPAYAEVALIRRATRTIDSTLRSTSSSVVAHEDTLIRMAVWFCHTVPPTQQTPSSTTPAITRCVTSGSPKETST